MKKSIRLEYVVIFFLVIILIGGSVIVFNNLSEFKDLKKDVEREQYAAFLYQCLFEHDFPSNETCGYVLC